MRPKPALLFSLQKSKQKASTPRSHKIYFYPGILQLPTVGQVKCLYNSVKNKFYRRLQRGALNGNGTAKDKSERQRQGGKSTLFCAVRASTRIIVCRLFFQICAVWAGLSLGAVWLNATLAQRDRPDGQIWKNVAHQTQTESKMLFCFLCVKIPTYHQPLFLFVLVVGADKEEYIRQQRRPEKD